MAETSQGSSPLYIPDSAKLASNRAYAVRVAIECICNEIASAARVAHSLADFGDQDDDFRQVIEFNEPHAEDLAAVLPQLVVLFSGFLKDMRLSEAA